MRVVKKYEHNGSLLTAREISLMYNIPDRLVWKAFNDPKFPSLEKMIEYRAAHGINDIDDYTCRDGNPNCERKFPKKVREKKVRTYSFKFKPPEPIVCIPPSLPKHDDIKPVAEAPGKVCKIAVGEKFGPYFITSLHRKHNTRFISVQCSECGKSFYDILLSMFVDLADSHCSCDKMSHLQVIRNMPLALQCESIAGVKDHQSFYNSFIGHRVCGLNITSVTKKEFNDGCCWIFGASCPICGGIFNTRAYDLITGRFHHGCQKRKKSRFSIKNSANYMRKKNLPHIHRSVNEDSILLLRNSVSNFSMRFGTEEFMNLRLDAIYAGKHEDFFNVFGI